MTCFTQIPIATFTKLCSGFCIRYVQCLQKKEFSIYCCTWTASGQKLVHYIRMLFTGCFILNGIVVLKWISFLLETASKKERKAVFSKLHISERISQMAEITEEYFVSYFASLRHLWNIWGNFIISDRSFTATSGKKCQLGEHYWKKGY